MQCNAAWEPHPRPPTSLRVMSRPCGNQVSRQPLKTQSRVWILFFWPIIGFTWAADDQNQDQFKFVIFNWLWSQLGMYPTEKKKSCLSSASNFTKTRNRRFLKFGGKKNTQQVAGHCKYTELEKSFWALALVMSCIALSISLKSPRALFCPAHSWVFQQDDVLCDTCTGEQYKNYEKFLILSY